MFQKRNVLFLMLFVVSILHSQTRVKTMFYNILNYENNTESQNRTPHLKSILAEVQPDLFMVCELKDEIASNYLFENAVLPVNANFKKADFRNSQSPATSLLQMVYYNSRKLTLEATKVIPTGIRDINHYTFVLNTTNQATNPTRLEVFVTHLKASRGEDNMQKREASVFEFIRDLERLPSNSNVLFAGDFNFYTSNEPGFQLLINDSNYIEIVDPINRLCPTFPNDGRDYYDEFFDNTYFWNNSTFADVHSQSTRSTSLADGSGGGMDDRFDFIMLSKNLTTSSRFYYVPESYKTIGNNGNCYNSFVSNTNCTGTFSQSLRNDLFTFSDHLPIVLEVESIENRLSTIDLTLQAPKIILKNDELTVSAENNIENIAIFNTLGQLVWKHQNPQTNKISISINHLKKGLYFIKAKNLKPTKFLYH